MSDLLSIYTSQAEMSSFFTDNMGIYNVKSYDATGDGATDDYSSISDCVGVADDNGGTVFFPTGDYKVSTDLTIPVNVTVWFAEGARLLPDSGKTVTINGSIQASLSQIFAGDGTIVLGGPLDGVYPQWWGASGDGDTTTTGSISAGSKTLTVASATTWKVGHGIFVTGAGAAGANLVTSVTNITGLTFTLADVAGAPVAGAVIRHDDIAAIQVAINAVSSGGTVFFPLASCYNVSSAIQLASKVALVGDYSRPTIKQTGTGATITTGAVIVNAHYADGAGGDSDILIANLTIENQYQNYLTPSTPVPNFLYGIFFGNVSKAVIRDCHILNTVSEGIYVGYYQSSEEIIIFNNRIENCFASGIAVTNGKKISILNNKIINTTIFGIDVEPNTSNVGEDIIITGNTINGVSGGYYKNDTASGLTNASMGISIQSGSLPDQTYDIVVSNNIIRSCTRENTTGLSDFGSIVISQAKHVVCEGNVIAESQVPGINIRGDSKYITLGENTIDTPTTTAIYIQNSNYISGNVGNINSPSNNGVQISASSYISIQGGQILNANNSGFHLTSCTNSAINGVVINDNRSGGDRTLAYGFYIVTGNNTISIASNIIINCTSDHVRNADGSINILQNGNFEDTYWRIKGTNNHWFSDGNIYQVGWIKPTAITAASAQNGTVFVDSADNKLKFKDSSGVVNLLY